jgi:hypothetical protein
MPHRHDRSAARRRPSRRANGEQRWGSATSGAPGHELACSGCREVHLPHKKPPPPRRHPSLRPGRSRTELPVSRHDQARSKIKGRCAVR